ncbi:hypothetical protein [Candidatus Poriferisodalis sp.]
MPIKGLAETWVLLLTKFLVLPIDADSALTAMAKRLLDKQQACEVGM